MKSYILFQQYIWLVNTIYRNGKISLEDLNRKWVDTDMSEGVPMARSTFNRHKVAIEDMFGIFIECDKRDGFKYYIGNQEVLEEDSIQNWMLSTLSVNNILAESKSVHDRILLESIPSDGENLHQFIDAMKHNVLVRITYRRYGAENPSVMLLEPYCVKLFNKRWYALVNFPAKEHFITLAFDRIIQLEVLDEKFEYDTEFIPAKHYSECYGILNDDFYEVETIRFRAYGQEANYQKDLPFHKSQVAINVTDEYTDYELKMKITNDFISPLLSRGAWIKILEPEWLAEEIRQIHLEAAEMYK